MWRVNSVDRVCKALAAFDAQGDAAAGLHQGISQLGDRLVRKDPVIDPVEERAVGGKARERRGGLGSIINGVADHHDHAFVNIVTLRPIALRQLRPGARIEQFHRAEGLDQPQAVDVIVTQGAFAVVDDGDHGGLPWKPIGRLQEHAERRMVGATGIEPVTPPV